MVSERRARREKLGRFRNGNRIVWARQMANTEWHMEDEAGWTWVLNNRDFRTHWEPIDERAKDSWGGPSRERPGFGRWLVVELDLAGGVQRNGREVQERNASRRG
jgi:hypothetical protein